MQNRARLISRSVKYTFQHFKGTFFLLRGMLRLSLWQKTLQFKTVTIAKCPANSPRRRGELSRNFTKENNATQVAASEEGSLHRFCSAEVVVPILNQLSRVDQRVYDCFFFLIFVVFWVLAEWVRFPLEQAFSEWRCRG